MGAAPSPSNPLPPPPSPAGPERMLLVLDLSRAQAETLIRAMGLPPYEAARRARRGGYQLHRVAERRTAEEEAGRLRAAGLSVLTVPEAEARSRPLLVAGGERDQGGLRLRVEGGPLRISSEQVFLVVWGPILREFQTPTKTREIATARPAEGYRIHLHRRGDVRPLELDPANFEFGSPPLAGSSLLELKSWVEVACADTPRDDAFRQEPPALSPAAPPSGGLDVARALQTGRRSREDPIILENLEQFRFYSGWRAAVERRR